MSRRVRVTVLVAFSMGSAVFHAMGQTGTISKDNGVAKEAAPAMWKVQGAHQTVYLFGTVHVMKPDVHWQTAKVTEAFKKSDTLYVEVADMDDVAKLQPMVMELGMDPAHPLSSVISKEDVAALDTAVKSMGLPGEAAIEPMKPWLVYVTLSMLPILKAGYDPKSGIDLRLTGDAKGASKPVKGFETAAQQMHYFADFSMTEQVALLHQELLDLPKSEAQTEETIGAWERGDVDKIADMENGEFKTKYPELYKKLVVERNARFADELATLLKSDKPGTAFVAIGAAHLAGSDSVQHDLEVRGFKAVRE
jgi:uncharacterized protein YbaP (TraB family)